MTRLRWKKYFLDCAKQAIVTYPNGYGASIIRYDTPKSGKAWLYEVAVLKDGNIVYDTPLTDDVLLFHNRKSLTEVLRRIEAL